MGIAILKVGEQHLIVDEHTLLTLGIYKTKFLFDEFGYPLGKPKT